ncbi:MAG: hypothetical protein U9P79_10060 [Candidatus Cloacimonadota bacterium]|nr:hypothetical protein [Candidatus Cloacimonadota bacterium]
MDFSFSGIFPSNKKQFLVLQYINHVPIDYDKIVIVSDFTKKLFEYVKKCDPNLM